MTPTRIAIVSASPLLAGGVAAALAGRDDWQLNFQAGFDDADALVVQARDAGDAVALHAALPPNVPTVLLGDDLRELAARAAHIEAREGRESRERRALALLSPQATPGQLRAALAAVLQGLSVRDDASPWARAPTSAGPGPYFGPHAGLADDHEPLTPRELEVFELLGKGLSNRDIAGVLGISVHTAKYHVGQILAKVAAATRAEAVSSGLKMGLIGL